MFVLPVETSDYINANSDHAERPSERYNRVDDNDLSSLGSFGEDEAVQAALQDPKAFETALKTGCEYSLPGVRDWLSIGREVRAEEEERQDTVQADLYTDAEADRRRESERLALVEPQRIADATENQRQIESIREESETVESTIPVDLVNILESGVLLADQGKLAETEKMYQRALEGYEKAWGPEHTSTLDTVNNLGNLYKNQGKMNEAKKMYQRALTGYKKVEDLNHSKSKQCSRCQGQRLDQGNPTGCLA